MNEVEVFLQEEAVEGLVETLGFTPEFGEALVCTIEVTDEVLEQLKAMPSLGGVRPTKKGQ